MRSLQTVWESLARRVSPAWRRRMEARGGTEASGTPGRETAEALKPTWRIFWAFIAVILFLVVVGVTVVGILGFLDKKPKGLVCYKPAEEKACFLRKIEARDLENIQMSANISGLGLDTSSRRLLRLRSGSGFDQPIVQIREDLMILSSEESCHWSQALGEDPEGRFHAKGQDFELERVSGYCKSEIPSVGGMNRDMEICVLQIECGHVIPRI
ncbi:uncharacterized protein [Pleurodeles waltl]|uniref:uncharacterized protein n=1 Tax=Pleurodeles waltl TaxID=8319 RepID=UPI00370978C8